MDEFPLNRAARGPAGEPKKIEQIAVAKRRRKPLGRQFKETFFRGTAKEAAQYGFLTVVVPDIQALVSDFFKQAIDKAIFGDERRINSAPPQQQQSPYGRTNYVPYNTVTTPAASARTMSQRARAVHDFGEIILQERTAALDVLERMKLCIDQFQVCTVSDLYAMVGLESNHVDHTWGWTGLHGAGVRRIGEDGYILNLPSPQPLGT